MTLKKDPHYDENHRTAVRATFGFVAGMTVSTPLAMAAASKSGSKGLLAYEAIVLTGGVAGAIGAYLIGKSHDEAIQEKQQQAMTAESMRAK